MSDIRLHFCISHCVPEGTSILGLQSSMLSWVFLEHRASTPSMPSKVGRPVNDDLQTVLCLHHNGSQALS